MSKLSEFLSELSDHELRAFHHFRFNEFMKGSQEKIMFEMEKRGVNSDDIEECITQARKEGIFTNRESLCPKCLSEKFYTASEVETITYSYATVELDVDYRTCLICHYSQDKAENSNPSGMVSAWGFITKLINRKR